MRILNFGGWANIGSILTEGFQKLGLQADYLDPSLMKYRFSKYTKICEAFLKYDVIFFHFLDITRFRFLNTLLLSLLKQKNFIWYLHGSELRNLSYIPKFNETVFVSTPDLLGRVVSPNCYWIRSPINPSEFFPCRSPIDLHEGKDFVIFHPFNSNFKGTPIIEKIVQTLSKDYSIRFIKGGNIPYKSMRDYYNAADIVITEIKNGTYGMVALESWLCKKPTLFAWKYDFFRPPPTLNSTELTLKSNLIRLLDDPQLRRHLGLKGYYYTLRNHHYLNVCKRCLQLIGELPES